MANIFNLFGEISEFHKGSTIKPLARSKTCLDINGSLKNVGQSKPKGLSIRSSSDLNVPETVQITFNKQQELLKPKLTQLDNNGQLISPRKNILSEKLSAFSIKKKDISPKKELDIKHVKSPLSYNESIFKKPLLLKNHVKKLYPEPENLAPYYDMQFEYDNIYTKDIENEFKELLKKKGNEIVLYEDEFELDQKEIKFEIPKLCISPIFDEEWIQYKIPDLPEISDEF
ncbi:uncharacterized protein LOC133667101 isoform X2 [Apis cerana]|uniref:Securin n=1 Tax=Apis cerana cerana TaxID=94128 RepID=A0A2A3E173_APICC|nr:uncharacterized protein LOC133667101 isoform X2 [Apis cerana]PBC25447.1 hypothetical protein APICC_03808 [Apis cerana cerana]